MMPSDEHGPTKSDQRLTTAELAQAAEQTRGYQQDDVRGRREETIANTAGIATAARHDDVRPTTVPAERARDRKQQPESHTSLPSNSALFEEAETQRLHTRWTDIQGSFVDEPRHAVQEADGLVAEVVKRLVEVFAGERTKLEQQWDRGDKVTTEDLRVALQRYRSFFDRLLSV